MEKSKSQNLKTVQQPLRSPRRFFSIRIALLCLVLLAALLWMITPLAPSRFQDKSIKAQEQPQHSSESTRPRARATPERIVDGAGSESAVRKPEPMKLEKRVLVSSQWNSSSNAFGLDKPSHGREGATVGPSSVAYANGNIYVLDNVNKRVLRYDENGKLLASIALPTKGATDLTTDDLGAVVVIDHHYDRIYKIENDALVLIGSVTMKSEFPIGTKFHYDTTSNTLSARDVDSDGLAKVDGNNLVLALGEGKEMSIAFDFPIACVEEVMTDAHGIVWVLYTLEGDYRMRRIARVDPARGSVGVAELDVWFPFDATRHMAPAQNGIVLFAGDQQEGRLVSFDYAGR